MANPYLIRVDRDKLRSLQGKTAIVTGGCSGIGLETVKILDSLGCKIVVGDVQAPPREEAALFSKSNIVFRECNVAEWGSLKEVFKTASQVSDHAIDFVIANAGINEYSDQFFGPKHDADGTIEEPDYRVLDVNLKGAANTVALSLHHLMGRGGSIVITASLSGYQGVKGMPVYSAAKHGVWGLMRSLKHTTAEHKVAISLVAPGFTRTPIMAGLPDQEDKSLEEIFNNLHRGGLKSNSPETVALALTYLASQGLSANGAALSVEADEIVNLEALLFDSRPEYVRTSLGYMFQEGPRFWD